ncbi:MAG: hypothetical protein ACREDS_08585, partial [Limisphaerales bacterium]
LQFIVTATGSSTVLQIGGRDDSAFLGLDDVSVTPALAPAITSLVKSGDMISLNLAGTPGFTYVLETTTNLALPDGWLPVVTNAVGTNGVWQFTDTITNNPQKFYRLQLVQ